MNLLLRTLTHVPAQPPLGHFMLLVGRVSLGLFMIAHAAGKWDTQGFGPKQAFIEGTADLGFPLPTLFAWNAMLAEGGCSLLLILGVFTRLSLLPLIFTMGVAAFVAHGGDPWISTGGPAKEMAMLYMFGYFMLLGVGPGKFSVDGLLSKKAVKAGASEKK